MFSHEIAINEFQLELFRRVAADLTESTLFAPSVGHGHPPVWILGHLAICGELGDKLLGGEILHPRWLVQFGPGSSNQVANHPSLTLGTLIQSNLDTYARFRERALHADTQKMQAPHSIERLKDTPIRTIGQLVSHLLTSHFGFHLSQLSSCRRSSGHQALF